MQGDLRKTVYKMIRIVYNTHVAMKSGLKGDKPKHMEMNAPSYTPYRDEKRTERHNIGSQDRCDVESVTLPTAMKSGLKVLGVPETVNALDLGIMLHSLPR